MALNKALFLQPLIVLIYAMISILLLLSLASPAIAVKGTSVYYHTGESWLKVLPNGCAEHVSEGSCKEGHRANANYGDYSAEAGIDHNECWPPEVDSNTNDGTRRRSVWVAPPSTPYSLFDPYCLWSYPFDDAANDCTSDDVVTMTIRQHCKTQLWIVVRC
jgi:hypothetical protein